MVGAVGWWLVLVAGLITLLLLTEHGRYRWTGVTVFALSAFLQFAAGINILGWIAANPLGFVVLVLGYAAIGVVYSLAKWRLSFLRQARERLDDFIARYKADVARKGSQSQAVSTDQERFVERMGWNWNSVRVRYNKARISAWIAYWPWSLLWTLIDDPFRKLGEWMYATFRSWYEALFANAFKGVEVPKN